MKDLIDRKAAIDAFGLSERTRKYGGDHSGYDTRMLYEIQDILEGLPSAQPEYKPVKAEDFAKTMSENTLYGFMAWHGEALALMKEQGFVICKKTM